MLVQFVAKWVILKPLLNGWRCRECASLDVYAVILGEEKESDYVVHRELGEAECSP